jgi:outer membrane receptor protein involved in Fe transport
VLALVLAVILAAAGSPAVVVVDENGAPIARAVVIFSAPGAAATDLHITGPDGGTSPRFRFSVTLAEIIADGFEPVTVQLHAGSNRVVLHRTGAAVIGSVRVATGSQQSLHRLPVPASVLDAAAIESSPAATSDALLRALPGFDRDRSNSAFTNYGQLRVSFGGAGNDRGVVLADGLPAQDAFGGQVDWSALPPGNLTRAELLRGAGSALYGSGAVGGVLALETRAPPALPGARPGGRIELGGGLGGSDASLFYRAPLGPKLAASLWTSTAQAAYFDLPESFRSRVDQIACSQSDATQLRVRTVGGPSAFEASALFSTDAQAQGRPNYSFGRTLQQGALSYSRAGDRTTTTVQAYARATTVLNVADQFPNAPGVLRYVQHVPTWENGVFAAWLAPGAHLDVEARGDLRAVHGISDQRGGDGTLQSLGSGAQTLEGFALQLRLHGPRFEALAGARYDDVAFKDGVLVSVARGAATVTKAPARADAAVSPRVALRYDLSPQLALRASSGGGFRAPFLNELVRGFQIGAVVMAPNPALIPERSRSDALGVDFANRTSRLSFDVAGTRVNDAIAFVTLSPALQQRRNVAHTRTDGAAATYVTLLAPCTRLRLSGQTQYARVTGGSPATIGKRLAYVPDREASAAIDTQGGDARYGIEANFIGAAFADDLNTQPLGSALLIGARASVPVGSATLTLAAENLTNRQYLSSQDRLGPPASVSLRLAFPIGAPGANAPPHCGLP